ncbi:flavodoxin-like protein [Marinilabilia salmonicolor]|jgi:putative NADPH-quinone reductase|uniref:NAD(P)H-dependent oxidoreductase n=1 Tax=Marinilabilia salmonicolor TaxID=989 RepID=UPI000D4F4E24|nr:flavodoxin-like protein [Marinilabilia salmonicolor]
MKNILIINGNPDKNSLCQSLAESYKEGCESRDVDCNLVNLADLHFDPVLH